jgi:hypothetical protein
MISTKEYIYNWKQRNKDKIKQYNLRYRQRHPEKVREAVRAYKARKRNPEWNKERNCLKCGNVYVPKTANQKYCDNCKQKPIRFKEQKICDICGMPETKISKNGNLFNLAQDHNHITGKNRGLLCSRCNTMLGKINENIDILKKMIEYLKRFD